MAPSEWNWWIFPLLFLAGVVQRFWLARGLQRAPVSGDELRSRRFRDDVRVNAEMTGRPTLWFFLVTGVTMCGVGIASAIWLDMPIGWLLAVMMGAGTAYFIWQLRLLGSAGKEPSSQRR
jgi:hypothetical protein